MAARPPTTITTNSNSLRERQIASLKKILSLNDSADSDEQDDQSNGFASTTSPLSAHTEPIAWKVLCFDDLGRDVISCVLRVSDLRALGITMHMYSHSRAVSSLRQRQQQQQLREKIGTYLRRDIPFPMCPWYTCALRIASLVSDRSQSSLLTRS